MVPEVVVHVVECLYVLRCGPAARLRGTAGCGLVGERDGGVVIAKRLQVVDPFLEVGVVGVGRVVRVLVADLLTRDVVPGVDVQIDARAVVGGRLRGGDRIAPARQRRVDALRLEGLAHGALQGARVDRGVAHTKAPEGAGAGGGERHIVSASRRVRRLRSVAGCARQGGQRRQRERRGQHGRHRDRDETKDRPREKHRPSRGVAAETVIPSRSGRREHQAPPPIELKGRRTEKLLPCLFLLVFCLLLRPRRDRLLSQLGNLDAELIPSI